MPSNVHSIRFSADSWGFIEREARLAGVTTAQFIREAAMGRAIAVAAMRGDEALAEWVEMLDAVGAVMRARDHRIESEGQ